MRRTIWSLLVAIDKEGRPAGGRPTPLRGYGRSELCSAIAGDGDAPTILTGNEMLATLRFHSIRGD